MRPARSWLLLPFLACALSACGNGKDATTSPATASADAPDAPLPTPAGASGSGVTGMPPAREGAEPAPAEAVASADAPADSDPAQLPDATAPAPGADVPVPGEAAPATPAEPGVADAVATLRDYYAAINAGNFGHAHGLWSDNGRASGQSPEQFAAGFAQTRSVSVDIGPPSRLEAAAGSRYLQLPVTVVATQRDGSERRYTGTYTLQRAVVDGATPEQRAWHLASASLRETGG